MSLFTQLISILVAALLSFAGTSVRAAGDASPHLSAPGSGALPEADVPTQAADTPARSVLPANLLGRSGELRAFVGMPATLSTDTALEPWIHDVALDRPGVHVLPYTASDGDSLSVISLLAYGDPLTRTSGYRLGSWPTDRLAQSDPRYAHPAGFITVTPQNQFTHISKHFRLADFVTHDQPSVWPKMLVLRPLLVDKLELVSQQLAREGLPDHLHVMSGFRSPQYNALGVGPGKGRARDSRHMYGDAADVFVDADGDGRMDDLNHDGRVDKADAQVLFAAAEEVEREHPETIGGLSAYSATAAHGPFVHMDVRGTRARW